MKKKNGLIQTFFYDFLKIQVTNWVQEILVTIENQSSIIYWFLLRYTVIIYILTQGSLGDKKIARSQFQSPVKKKNHKLRHWRSTAWSLYRDYNKPSIFYRWFNFLFCQQAVVTKYKKWKCMRRSVWNLNN